MAPRITTTQELYDEALANIEGALNQNTPLPDKAFNRVLAGLESMNHAQLLRYARALARENLALTAGDEGLKVLGDELGVEWRAAIAAQLTIRATAEDSTEVPAGASFTSDTTSGKYTADETTEEDGGYITLIVTADIAGAAGNLAVDDTLTMDIAIEGVGSTWTVMASVTTGLERMDREEYRRRVLNEERTVGGGGNLADYRTWAERTPGCYRAFPYSGAFEGYVSGFVDGDMEEEGTDNWDAGEGNGALTKETADPQAGTRYLRVTVEEIGYAQQDDILVTGAVYRVRGYARGDGVDGIPRITIEGVAIWTGTNDSAWQEFDEIFTSIGGESVDIRLEVYGGGPGDYAEFDSLSLVLSVDIPGAIAVFVEADSEIDSDGIPDQDLLDDVRDYINTNPDTGKSQPPLGTIDELLYVEPIRRTALNVEIRDLVIDDNIETEAKEQLETIVDVYLRTVCPHIVGLDPASAKDDIITNLTVSLVIQDYLQTIGATAGGIGIYIEDNTYIPSYALGAGELAKLGEITYI